MVAGEWSSFSKDYCCRLFCSHEHMGSTRWTQWVFKKKKHINLKKNVIKSQKINKYPENNQKTLYYE